MVKIVLAVILLPGCNWLSLSDKGRLFSYDLKPEIAAQIGLCESSKYENSWGQELPGYSELLQKYVFSDGAVDYAGFRDDASGRSALQTSIQELQNGSNETREQKIVRYINLYNALTLNLILEHYDSTLGLEGSPMEGQRSIRNIDGLDFEVWNHFRFLIDGQMRTLNELENALLRPLGEPRIHFAINCASKGCPRLLRSAFESEHLNEQLNFVTCEFVNDGTQTQFDNLDPLRPIIFTSSILDWFWADFATLYGDPRQFFAAWLDSTRSPVSSEQINSKRASQFQWKVEYNEYDWALNE